MTKTNPMIKLILIALIAGAARRTWRDIKQEQETFHNHKPPAQPVPGQVGRARDFLIFKKTKNKTHEERTDYD